MAKKKTKKTVLKKDSNVIIRDIETIDVREDVQQALRTIKAYCAENRTDCSKCMYSTSIYNEALDSAHAFCNIKGCWPLDYREFEGR